jgi:hypothetical protein
MLGKTPLSKNAHEKTHIHRAKFNGRPKLPGWLGERWCSPEPGRAVAFIQGKDKEVSTGAVVSGRCWAVLEHGNLFKGRAAILADSQNGDIIVLSITSEKNGISSFTSMSVSCFLYDDELHILSPFCNSEMYFINN